MIDRVTAAQAFISARSSLRDVLDAIAEIRAGTIIAAAARDKIVVGMSLSAAPAATFMAYQAQDEASANAILVEQGSATDLAARLAAIQTAYGAWLDGLQAAFDSKMDQPRTVPQSREVPLLGGTMIVRYLVTIEPALDAVPGLTDPARLDALEAAILPLAQRST